MQGPQGWQQGGHGAHGQGHGGHRHGGHREGGHREAGHREGGQHGRHGAVPLGGADAPYNAGFRPQQPPAGNNAPAPPPPSNPSPTPNPTPQQLEEIVKKTKGILFDRLKPFCKGDRADFSVNVHSGRIEFCFPFKKNLSLIPVLQYVCESAKKGSDSTQTEICVNFLREKFMVCRIKDTNAGKYGPPYRLEVMVPLDGGNALVMAGAGGLTMDDVDLCETLYKFSCGAISAPGKDADKEKADEKKLSKDAVVDKLRSLGIDVLLPEGGLKEDEVEKVPVNVNNKDQKDKKENKEVKEKKDAKEEKFDPDNDKLWEGVAGYDDVKFQVKQCITLPLMRPDLFSRMSQLTRGGGAGGKKTSGVLFTGPPGVGKTTMARVAAHVAGMPLVYVPVESVVSKWYGEAEQRLRQVFELTRQLGSAVLFLDELDAFAGNRDNSIHEVTRRILSVLLRQLDGLDSNDSKENKENEVVEKKWHIVLVGATNRPTDLDAALRSRFNKIIDFPLPDEATRGAIFKSYAKTLQPAELAQLATNSESFSCRDIRECADNAEQLWVAQLMNNKGFNMSLSGLQPPPYKTYLEAIKTRKIPQQ